MGMARRVVGVGSVGTSAWVVLLAGADENDYLVLQAKEATASVLAPFVPGHSYPHQGRRVVEGQRLMQAYGDILLGWKSADVAVSGYPRDYYVRQFRDWKGSFEPADLNADQLGTYADACAWTLARAHARSGDRVAIAAYLGGKDRFDRAIADFAVAYADKTETDYERVRAAKPTMVGSRRVRVREVGLSEGSGESLGLDLLEVVGADGAGVEERLGVRDLLGRGTAGDLADVLVAVGLEPAACTRPAARPCRRHGRSGRRPR